MYKYSLAFSSTEVPDEAPTSWTNANKQLSQRSSPDASKLTKAQEQLSEEQQLSSEEEEEARSNCPRSPFINSDILSQPANLQAKKIEHRSPK